MLATLVDAPFHRPGWVWEEKYDGIRLIALKDGRRVRLLTRNDKDRTADFPEVAAALAALPAPTLVLDGEVVVFDAAGVSRFQLLQRRAAGASPPIYVVFDCLHARGRDLLAQPLDGRRAALEAEVARGRRLRVARRLADDGLRAFAEARRRGLEGVIGKDPASPYLPGVRSPRLVQGEGAGRGGVRDRRLHGAARRPPASRRAAGRRAGTAARSATRARSARASPRRRSPISIGAWRPLRAARHRSPTRPATRDVTWVEPRLVAQLGFTERTGDGKLRHPAFLGLRDDKARAEVRWTGPPRPRGALHRVAAAHALEHLPARLARAAAPAARPRRSRRPAPGP